LHGERFKSDIPAWITGDGLMKLRIVVLEGEPEEVVLLLRFLRRKWAQQGNPQENHEGVHDEAPGGESP